MFMISKGITINELREVGHSTFDPTGRKGWAFLTRSDSGGLVCLAVTKSGGGWHVKPVDGVASDCKKVELVKGSLTSERGLRNGLPYFFQVDLTDQNNAVCRRNLYATDRVDMDALRRGQICSVHGGYYPTVMVSLAGPAAVGKSVLTHAMQTAGSVKQLQRYFYEEISPPDHVKPGEVAKLQGNEVGSYVLASFLVKTAHGPVQVCIADVAGELYDVRLRNQFDLNGNRDYDPEVRLIIDRITNNLACYTDAVIELRKGSRLLEGDEACNDNVDAVLSFLPPKVLRATVISQAAQVRDHLKKTPDLMKTPVGSSSAAFAPCSSMEDVYRHAAVAGHVANEIYLHSCGDAAFFVDSCREKENNMLDFSDPLNVTAPLAWVLHRLLDLTPVNH